MKPSPAKPKPKAAPRRAAGRIKRPAAGAAKLTGAGVVRYYVQGSAAASTQARFAPAKLVEALQAGLPFGELQDLQSSLAVPTDRLAPMLGISKATLHRQKGAESRLSPAVSDRVVRYARLLGQAFQVFGDLESAKLWLGRPQVGLGGAVPLDYAKTEIGAREVEHLLGRIEYGVYS
jgi:putative toxin-antitoxin system antitoxin component (TIGR02293 family)